MKTLFVTATLWALTVAIFMGALDTQVIVERTTLMGDTIRHVSMTTPTIITVLGFVLFGTATLLTIAIVVSMFTHIEELGVLRKQDDKIANAEERISELEKRISSALGTSSNLDPESLMARANDDSPVSGIVKELAEAQDELRKTKDRKAYLEAEIESRKIGPFRFIVSMYGEK